MGLATFNGSPIFGPTVHCQPVPSARAEQRDSYPGLNGYTSLDLGSRGGVIRIRGVLVADVFADLPAVESALLAVAGQGVGTLIDPLNRTFQAYFKGEYTPNPDGAYVTDSGVCLFYTATFYYVP